MAIPKNVQRQLDQAEALAAQMATEVTASPPAINDPSQLTAQPAPTPPAPAPAPEPAPAPPAPTEDWQNRFRAMKGRYDAEVPELKAQNAQLMSRVTALSEQMAALTASANAPAPAPAVDPRDQQQFGEDMVDMVLRTASQADAAIRAEFTAALQQLDKRLKAMETGVEGVAKKTEQTLEDAFYSSLDEHVPDWEQINGDQRWIQWLGEIDPVYGVPRQTALDSAFNRKDSKRVVAIFKQFKAAQPVKAAAPSLEAQVAPRTSGNAAAPTPPAANVQLITQAFVSKFYTDVAKGRYAGRPDEEASIEQLINTAAQEGRIV